MSGQFGGAGTPKLDMNMELKKASLEQATRSSAGINPVTGYFDFSGQFTGKGLSQQDIMSSLTGDGKIVASPGLIHGVDIPALSTNLSNMNSNNALLSLLGTTLSGGQTAYKGGESQLIAKDGMIDFSPFDIELEGAKSNVNLALNLARWDIRSTGRLSLTDHPHAPPIEVSILGNVSNPKVNFKTDRLQKYVGAKIASGMLQQLIGGEGGLEGLFGGAPKTVEGTPPAGASNVPSTPASNPAEKTVPLTPPQEQSGKEGPDAANPAEEFGKRLLQKLFEKDNKTETKEPEKPDTR